MNYVSALSQVYQTFSKLFLSTNLRYSKNVRDTKHEVPFLVLGVWSECEDCNSEPSSASRSLNTLGPARRVAETPFLIVTGKVPLTLDLFLNL